MRHSLKALGAAVLLGLGLMTSQAHATTTAVFTVTVTNPSGPGTWKAFEQNVYTAGSASSGLAGINFNVTTTGGVKIATGTFSLPSGFDTDSGTSNGFTVFKSNGTLSGGQLTGLAGAQASNYQVNPAGDVFNIYTGVGNMAETIPTSDDGSGDGGVGDAPGVITTKTITLPVLIAQGTYTVTGSGSITASTTTDLMTVLPSPMPSAGSNVATNSPDAVTPGSAFINVPEPGTLGILALGSIMALARHRRTKSA